MSTDQPIEVKKDGLRQMQDGTWKLSLTVHPNDMPTSLMTAPMGTRYGMALVEIGDDEQPVPSTTSRKPLEQKAETSKHRKPAGTRAEKARRMCGVATFQQFLGTTGYEMTSDFVKQKCGVTSKSTIDADKNAAMAWDRLFISYEQEYGRMAERH